MVMGQEDRSLTGTDSFTRFYSEWFARGVGFAERTFGLNREDAKEVASNAMEVVNAAWGNIERPEAFFQTVVRRRAIDMLRKTIRRERAEVPLVDPDLDDGEETSRELIVALTSALTPESSYLEREDAAAIHAALAMLPTPYRISLGLAAEGYSAEERALIKDVPVSTERSPLRRAREMCIRLLASLSPKGKTEAVKTAEKLKNELSEKKGGRESDVRQ